MKKTVLYITYIDFGNMLSGSSVRPQKMYQAFIDCGFNIKLLSGSTKNVDKKKRVKNINEIREWLKFNTPDFCYIESPTTHINFKEDRDLIKLIHNKGIKIGYFYRDALYKLGNVSVLSRCVRCPFGNAPARSGDRCGNYRNLLYVYPEVF